MHTLRKESKTGHIVHTQVTIADDKLTQYMLSINMKFGFSQHSSG